MQGSDDNRNQARLIERESKLETRSLKIHLIGSCHKVINHKYISKLEVKSNILMRTVTQSSLASVVLGRQGAAGSKHVFSNVVERDLPQEVSDVEGDIYEAFDNNERGQRTYHAKLDSTLKMSLVTGRLIFRDNPSGKLQQEEKFLPGNFTFQKKAAENPLPNITSSLINKQLNIAPDSKAVFAYEFQRSLNNYLDKAKKALYQDAAGVWKDDIATSKSKSGESSKKRKHEEIEDEYRFVEVEDSEERDVTVIKQQKVTREQVYGRVKEFHKAPIKPVIADPIFKNPNSFESLIEIFRIIVEKNIKRKWLVLISDGVPFVLGWKVILWSYICNECDCKVFKDAEWKKHCKTHHSDLQHPLTFRMEFHQLLLVPGGGHILMNMLKGLRDVTFDIWGAENAALLGCRTPKSKLWFKNCTDTHISWENTLVEKGAVGMEIMSYFAQKCLNELKMKREEVTLKFFLESFIEKECTENANIKLMFGMLSFYQSIAIFDIGIHRNNPDYIQSGIDHFGPVWHCRNHPIYRILYELRDYTLNVLPPEVRSWVLSIQSNLQSSDKTCGQAPDFRVEENNASVQNLLPPGAPSEKTWKWVYRQFDALQLNRKQWFEQEGLKDPKDKKHNSVRAEENLESEINALRSLFRERKYLESHENDCTNLAGNKLHPDLKNILEISKKARVNNLQKVVSDRSFLSLSTSTELVFVTDEEEMKWQCRSLKQMNTRIEEIISNLPSPTDQEEWRALWHPWKIQNTKEAAGVFLRNLENNDKNSL